jgi:hypothetical protein
LEPQSAFIQRRECNRNDGDFIREREFTSVRRVLGFEEAGYGGVCSGRYKRREGDVMGHTVDDVSIGAQEVDNNGDDNCEAVGGPEVGFMVGPEVDGFCCVDSPVLRRSILVLNDRE